MKIPKGVKYYKNIPYIYKSNRYYYKESCEVCNEPFLTQYRHTGKYCSKSCSNKNTKKGNKHTKTAKQKMSKSQKGRVFSKEHKERLSIYALKRYKKDPTSNPAYIDGRSSHKHYCSGWFFLKEEIKQRDKNKCQNPHCWRTSISIVVHHIDYNKQNCHWNNLITLCNSCNVRANYDRNRWEKLYERQVNTI